MGPRAGDPPQFSSTPPRPPDPSDLGMKLQIAKEETSAWCRELEQTAASLQSEILHELRQLRLERTAQVMEPSVLTSSVSIISPPVTPPVSLVLHFGTIDSYQQHQQLYMMPPPPPLLATSDPYHYQQQQRPPPPPSSPLVRHQQQGVWYSNQNQYQYHSLQPPLPPQQWAPPTHTNNLPPSLGYYHPPLPPHYAHRNYPQSLSHGPPQAYHPRQLNREWGAQSPPRLVQQKSGSGLAEMGPEINSFCSPGSSPIMTMGSIPLQAIGCFSTMEECLNGNSLTLPTESTLPYSPALVVVDSGVSIRGDKGKMMDDGRNCNLGTSLGTNKFISDALKSGEGSTERQQFIQNSRLGYSSYLEDQVPSLDTGLNSAKSQLSSMEMAACMVKNEHFGSKIGKNDEPAIRGSLSQLLESIKSVSSLPPPSIQTSLGPAQLMSPTRSLVPEKEDAEKNRTGELIELDSLLTMVGNSFQYALPKCYKYGKDIGGTCSVVNVFNALCARLKHYIEGSRKSSHYVLQVCFSGFDKKVRDKGGGHTLLTDEFSIPNRKLAWNLRLLRVSISNLISAVGNLETVASGNSLKFTFSLIITLIELWSYGYVEKNIRGFTKISVISFGNGCFDFHHDHGLISSGIECNSSLMSENDKCIVVLCWNMNEEDVMEEIELPPEVCDLFNGDWVFNPVNHPLYKEDKCEFSTAQVTCMRNGRRNSLYQHWRWQARECNLSKFNARLLLEKLRKKRLVFVSDSLNRNQQESIISFAQSAIPPGIKSSVTNGSRTVFRIEDCNPTVKYKWETKRSGNLLMLAHPLHVKLLMNDIEVVQKGIKPFSLKDLGILLDDSNGIFYLVFVKTDKSTPQMELVFEKEKCYMAIGYDITDEKANVNIVNVHVKKAFDEKWVAEIARKIVMVMTNARLYITTHTKVIIGVCKIMQISKYEIRNSGDLFTDQLARHFSHMWFASNPLRYCSSSTISIVATLLLCVALVLCATAIGVMKTIEKAQNDEFGEKAEKKQRVSGLYEKKLSLIILLQYGISKVRGEFISDIFCLQLLLDLVRKMLQTWTWKNRESLQTQMIVVRFLCFYMVMIRVDDVLEFSSKDTKLVKANSTYECLTPAKAHVDPDVYGCSFITCSELILHIQMYSKLLALRCLPAEIRETRGFQKETTQDGCEVKKFWFADLAICCSSRLFLKLEVKFQLKRGGVVRTQFYDLQAQVCIEAHNSSFGCESP